MSWCLLCLNTCPPCVVCVLQLESLNQSELASRLTLNCQNSYVEPHKIKDVAVTIIDVSVKPSLPIHVWVCYSELTRMFSLWMVWRCLIRALCHWRRRRRCTSCILTQDELIWKQEETSRTCAGVPKSTSTYRYAHLLTNLSCSLQRETGWCSSLGILVNEF